MLGMLFNSAITNLQMIDRIILVTHRSARMVGPMKRIPIQIIVAALAAMPTFCPGQATLEGKVELPKSHFAPVMNERYEIVSKAGVLKTEPPRAVVYLQGDFSKPAKLPTQQIAQKDFAFRPALLPIEVGTKVEFPNLDDTYHNIFSY